MFLAKDLIDEVIDERIKKLQAGRSQAKKDKDIRYPDGSSDGMSRLQRYIKAANKRDN